MSVLFVVLAVADDPLPAYLAYPSVRWLGAAVVCLLLLSLAASFGAIFPYTRRLPLMDSSFGDTCP